MAAAKKDNETELLVVRLEERMVAMARENTRENALLLAAIEANRAASEKRSEGLEKKMSPMLTAFEQAKGMKRMALFIWAGATVLLAAAAKKLVDWFF